MSGTEILINILGGVALLLWGVRMIRTGMMRAFGASLRTAIGVWTGNRVKAALAGTMAAAIVQSSTATALMVCSFVAHGALATAPALAVMLGADLGAAIGAQIFTSGIAGCGLPSPCSATWCTRCSRAAMPVCGTSDGSCWDWRSCCWP